MDVYEGSPVHTSSKVVREFKLPSSSGPWSKLVIEPPRAKGDKKEGENEKEESEGGKILDACGEEVAQQGRITLRTKNNAIAMVFDCKEIKPEGLSFCQGKEIDPAELEYKPDSEASKDEKEDEKSQCGKDKDKKDKPEDKKKEDEKKPEAPRKDQVKPKSPDQIFKDGKITIDTTPKLKVILDHLRPALDKASLADLKVIARSLAKGSKWEKEVGEIIADLKEDDAKSLIKKPNLINAILFLLNQKPDEIPKIAKDLGISVDHTADNKEAANAQVAQVDYGKFLKLVNELRSEKGLGSVSYAECPQKMAEYWSKHEKAPGAGHEIEGDNLTTRVAKFACNSPAMENVSWPSNFEADHIFTQWKESEGHLANMVRADIKKIGLFCMKETGVKNGNFCVMTGTAD